ncbi:unnamed protein product [Auanema sp. JU1783]|nr:unnamed protein product [Auanema sp. JU1783]
MNYLTAISSVRHLSSFITTPIYYANAVPHVGHLYTSVISDAYHRWMKLKYPNDTHLFSTGTDEHGIKILRAAEKSGQDVKLFCDSVSQKFREVAVEFGVEATHYIRTTDVAHKQAVHHLWKVLYDNDLIYKDIYKGWYSVVDECFYKDKDVEEIILEGKKTMVVKGTKTIVELIEEENYMFKLSKFKNEVRDWIVNSDVIRPKHYLPQVLKFLEMEDDLSVSRCRKRLPWGIDVPSDDQQTIYVWLDALVNYLTVIGYPQKSTLWPPSCQLLGKDIIKFHALYWPAFLLGAGLPLPRRLFIHGHWLVDNTKMSKSLGNVVNPIDLKQRFTAEGVRYFLLKQGVPHEDSNFTEVKALNVINSDLVNNLGNLLSRSTVPKLNVNQIYPNSNDLDERLLASANELIEELNVIRDKTTKHYDDLMFYKGIEAIMSVLKQANGLFQLHEPWKMTEEKKLSSLLFICYESVRISAILLQPIIPSVSDHTLTRLGIVNGERNLTNATFRYNTSSRGSLGKNNAPFMNRLK